MIFIYVLSFFLMSVGIVLIFRLTPESITDDFMKFLSPKQTLRDKVLSAKGKKQSRRITNEILHIKDALETTGKTKQFTIAFTASLFLMVLGCVFAILIDNYFMIPVFTITFASIPYFVIKSTISAYEKHLREEMETALSIITTSYIRSDDIVGAIKENLTYLKPPIREIFARFTGKAMLISSDIKASLRKMKNMVNNDIFSEWCDTLIACQDDRTLKDTLLSIVGKLTDVRIVNNELKTMLSEVQKEYWIMVLLVIGNIPLIYMLNRDWFDVLMFSIPGKVVLAVCGIVIMVTAFFMMRFTKPVEYKR